MPEAITKYAVNSTLGTEEFKPLDKIIMGQKSLVASDNPYILLDGFELSKNDGEKKNIKNQLQR